MKKLKSSFDKGDIEKEVGIDNSSEMENMKLLKAHEQTREKETNNDYSTITKQEASLEININTQSFDLYKGLLYMFLSCIFKSLFSILSKYSLKDKTDLSSFQLLSYRTYFMLWITIIITMITKINIFSSEFVKPDKVIPVIVRTFFAIISVSLLVYCIRHMHISDVYSVYYIYPGFIVLLSLVFLKNEKLAMFDFICLFTCFIGAIFIVKPDFIFQTKTEGGTSAIMFSLVIVAAFVKAVEDVIVRNIGKDAHFLIFPFMYSVFGMILFPIPMLLFDTHYPSFTFSEVVVVFCIAVCTYLYQTFMALGLQNESASRVSMVNYVQVALMYLSDLLLFDKKFQVLDLIGTLFIFGFNLTNGIIKALKRQNELINVKSKALNENKC